MAVVIFYPLYLGIRPLSFSGRSQFLIRSLPTILICLQVWWLTTYRFISGIRHGLHLPISSSHDDTLNSSRTLSSGIIGAPSSKSDQSTMRASDSQAETLRSSSLRTVSHPNTDVSNSQSTLRNSTAGLSNASTTGDLSLG